MKKGSILFSFLLVLLLGFSQVYAQSTIDITSPNHTISDPSDPDFKVVSVCQCDTIGTSLDLVSGVPKSQALQYYIGGAAFNPSSDFYYEIIYNYAGTPSAIDDSLELFALTPAAPNQANPVDTFGIGAKLAHLIIPCNAPIGTAAIRIINSTTGNPTSDTAYFNINQMPNKPVIDSIAYGFPNNYAPKGEFWAFCPEDSVILYAEDQGANITWLKDGAPYYKDGVLQGGVGFDSLVVNEPGTYAVRMDHGFCERDSKDTIIIFSETPTEILMDASSAGFQIDNPNTRFLDPVDSIQFCEDATAILVGPEPTPASGLTFIYTWLTDSIDSFSGDTIFYPARGRNDSIHFSPDTTARFYLVVNDGFCSDTSAPYYAFEDSIPQNLITHRHGGTSVWGPKMQSVEICMRDSLLLETGYPLAGNLELPENDTLLEFQWQRFNTNLNSWDNIPSSLNPGLDGKKFFLQVDTSVKPIATISFYRLRVWTLTPFTKSRVCEYTTDSIVVRWKPQEYVGYQPQPWVTSVDNDTRIDSINFCARDSAVLTAPIISGLMRQKGYDFSYQWVKDSLDTAINRMVKIPINGETDSVLTVNESGRYYVRVDDGICVDTLGFFRVFVDSLPSTSLVNVPSNSDRLLCLDESVTISAVDTVFGFNHWDYAWLIDDGTGWTPLMNDTLPHLVIDTSYLPQGGDTLRFALQTMYTNQFGLTICPDTTAMVEVIFFQPPTINFTPGDSIGVCPGDSVMVIALGNSFTYQWSNGGVTADTWLRGAGRYTVTGTGVNGCTNTRDVVIYDLVTVANAGPDVTIFSGETAQLTATGGIDYQWGASKPIAWGNILSANTSVSYTLPEGVKSDTIQIYVKVSSSNGCFAYDTLNLFVVIDESAGTALIDQAWNVFTPDGNGKSDVWDISSITDEYGGCRIDIMNRWGSVIFVDESFDGIWDGTNNGGSPMSDGTYYYILSCDGEIILKNSVTIIRNQ